MAKQKSTQKTVQKTVQKTAQRTATGVRDVTCRVGSWLWKHKKPILVNAAWLGVGTMIGAVRVIPPPVKLVKLGLFRISA